MGKGGEVKSWADWFGRRVFNDRLRQKLLATERTWKPGEIRFVTPEELERLNGYRTVPLITPGVPIPSTSWPYVANSSGGK